MRNQKIGILAVIALLCAGLLSSYIKPSAVKSTEEEGIQWLTLEQAMEAQANSPKKIMIDLYTDWCGWCKVMDNTTFKDPNVVTYINKNFYAVKLNAEADQTVTYKGKSYVLGTYNNRKTHLLAVELGVVNNRIGYPTLVFLDEKGTKIAASPGFKDTEAVNKVLQFYGNDIYKKMDWQNYINNQ
jgi:thioredoxin-related protein